MHAQNHPVAVRLIGFDPPEGRQLAVALAQAPRPGPSYFCLLDDSLQEPDLLIVNGDRLAALAMLSDLLPALIVGQAEAAFPFPQLARPLDPFRMHELLARQLAGARTVQRAPDRRRRPRPDLDLTDPAEFQGRRQPPPAGAVLIVDAGGAFRDHVAQVLDGPRRLIEWTDSAATALRLCEETPVALVLINTATPGIDPYLLCSDIKAQGGAERIAVVFLVSPAFRYDAERARSVGVRGLLDKPVADRHLVAALGKLLSLPA
jgi:CheY-like chemotaxis protein